MVGTAQARLCPPYARHYVIERRTVRYRGSRLTVGGAKKMTEW
jgi:hypothetical protein